jgi:integrase/recombinase XerC
MNRYMEVAVRGSRSPDVEQKIELQLGRFRDFQWEQFGQEAVTALSQRNVREWLKELKEEEGFSASTINNHQANLSQFLKWISIQAPYLLKENPAKGIKSIHQTAPDPRALTEDQVRSLKSICDRLERFHQLKGRKWSKGGAPLKAHARPKRDRAIVFTLLSTGLRREELVRLDLDQLEPRDPEMLRTARIIRVQGKGKTERYVFLSFDARQALADYLMHERPRDADPESKGIFLSASGIPVRHPGGRMDKRSINRILEQIGKWHDAEQADPDRHIAPLRPHDLRHTFAFRLSKETGRDKFELQRRLGHRSDKYIQIYTNPPDEIAAGYIETL